MKKKCLALFFALILCFFSALPAFAAGASFVIDEANLLSESKKAALSDRLAEISRRQEMAVAAAAVDSLGGASAQEIADELYESGGFGQDGILLLICPESRDWAVSTSGLGRRAFTDAGIAYLIGQIRPDLSAGRYAAALDEYADLCDRFLSQASSGEPYDAGNLPLEPLSWVWIPLSLGIGLVLALIAVGAMKSKLKSVRAQAAAQNYLKKDSLSVTEKSDLFLYRSLSRTEKPKEQCSGSSTHTSASGAEHGGSSGKF